MKKLLLFAGMIVGMSFNSWAVEIAPIKPININQATGVELMQLPGIGESKAQGIIAHRMQKKIEKPEDLLEVKGIGPKILDRIRPYLIFDSTQGTGPVQGASQPAAARKNPE